MGAMLSKQWIFQGVYYDLIRGFSTTAGGYPIMIAYPEGLRDLPEECPKCMSGSGLRWIEMNAALMAQRLAYMEHAEAIFEKRLAKGETDPYHGFQICSGAEPAGEREEKLKQGASTPPSSKTPTLWNFLKGNEVSPDPEGLLEGGEERKDCGDDNDVEFVVDRDALLVCDYCMEDRFKGRGYIRQYEQEVEEEEKKKLEKLMRDSGRGGEQKILDVSIQDKI